MLFNVGSHVHGSPSSITFAGQTISGSETMARAQASALTFSRISRSSNFIELAFGEVANPANRSQSVIGAVFVQVTKFLALAEGIFELFAVSVSKTVQYFEQYFHDIPTQADSAATPAPRPPRHYSL
jgi:hypothetical protein